jgi:hypothetical protein
MKWENKAMKGKWLNLVGVLMLAAVLAVWSAPAQAYVFGFDDMAYITSSTTLHTVFGAGSGPYPGAGIYQNENDSYVGWTPYVFRYGGTSTTVVAEFIRNDVDSSNNTVINVDGIHFTAQGASGWGPTGGAVNGHIVGSVTNLVAPTLANNLNFHYLQNNGGIANDHTFTLNSLALEGTGTVTLTGYAADGTTVIGTDTETLGSSFQTYTENWANVFSVQFIGLGGIGSITMDNVRLNEAVPAAVPIPPSVLLLGSGLLGLVGLGWQRKKFKA